MGRGGEYLQALDLLLHPLEGRHRTARVQPRQHVVHLWDQWACGAGCWGCPGHVGGGARTYPRPPPHHQAQKKTLCVKYRLVWISTSACAPKGGFIDCGRKSTSHVLRTPTGRYLPRSFFWVWSVSRGSQVLLFKLQSSNRPIVNRQLQ